jgi:hypothetical protein
MRKRILWMLPVAVAAGAAAVAAADPPGSPTLTPVPTANTRSAGYAPASKLSPELTQVIVAQGSTRTENVLGGINFYGYDSDKTNTAGDPIMIPSTTAPTLEAHKTEPDKNTYLVFKNGLKGADPAYNYGTHFLFQGHESGTPGYFTRINLDADAAHRVTLLGTIPTGDIDGSTWDPWAKQLLLTTENINAPTYAATPDFPSTVTDLSGSIGKGGYEGIQDDSDGNLWIAEDIGGSNKPGTVSKFPNSYIYRYVPKKPGDLLNGKLQALQVLNAAGQPITAESQTAVNSPDQLALHTYGKSFKTTWVTIHNTATDGTTAFQALPLAKAAHATPFKRPENGAFRPGSKFKEFFFDETGDTNAGTPPQSALPAPENADAGGWGSIFKVTQADPSADTGMLTIAYKATEATAAPDNVAFLSKNVFSFVQDAGDTLHAQANALDSAYAFDVTGAMPTPWRWLAEGRDASATYDAGCGNACGNDGDNEITGLHVSDGDPTVNGILGAKNPELSNKKWRWFYTQQHGDNFTWEVLVNRAAHGDDGDDNDDQ